MGSGGKTTHATYATAPTAEEPAPDATELLAAGGDNGQWKPQQAEFEEAIDSLKELAQGVGAHALENPSDDALGSWYQDFQTATAHAWTQLETMGQAETPNEPLIEEGAAFHGAVSDALNSLTPEELKELAKAQGFEHPELVGITTQDGKPHPLSVWLSPMSEDQVKERIQAKALERFAALCAGESVAGLSYSDIEPPSAQHGTWTATPEQMDTLTAQAQEHASGYQMAVGNEAAGQQLAALIETENHLVTAYCPAKDSGSVAALKAQSTAKVDAVLEKISPYSPALHPALEAAKAAGKLTDEQWAVLSMQASLRLARDSTPSKEKENLEETAHQRMAQLMALKSAYAKITQYIDPAEGGLQLPENLSVNDPDSISEVAGFAHAANEYVQTKVDVLEWFPGAPINFSSATQDIGVSPEELGLQNDYINLTDKFTKWANKKDTKALKQVAGQLGLEGDSGVHVYDAKKWIAAQWDLGLDKEEIKKHIVAKKQKAADKKSKGSPESGGEMATSGAAQEQKPSSKPVAAETPQKTGWAGKHAKLVQALQQHGALWTELPKPVDPTIVANHDFGQGTSGGVLGGVHTKSVHTGPDGNKWMFKPDHQAKGAKASAEAAASSIFAAAGVPAVPVYTATINGKNGVVQPLVPNAVQLSPDTSSWTQSDIDALVRAHVVSWTIGDHDGNHANIIKTPAGGLVPVDAGQAFKYFGKDKLATDYHPNAKYGSPLPAHHQAYKGYKSGELAKGVKINPAVAHPVIANIEKIPDSQWRAMLHSAAHQGAKSSEISWVPTMRKQAANKHGIPEKSVSTNQIADAFLDHACERKKNLRSAFTKFFEDLGVDGVAALKYGA